MAIIIAVVLVKVIHIVMVMAVSIIPLNYLPNQTELREYALAVHHHPRQVQVNLLLFHMSATLQHN